MQSKTHSFLESLANVAIGYTIAVTAQIFIFPLYSITVDLQTNLWIGFWFTLISITRSYFLRRLFNIGQRRQAGLQAASDYDYKAKLPLRRW